MKAREVGGLSSPRALGPFVRDWTALARLCLPFALSDAARTDYEFYLTAHPDAAFALAIRRRDEAALRVLVGLGLPTAAAAALCGRTGWSSGAAILLQRPKKAPKSYDFDDL